MFLGIACLLGAMCTVGVLIIFAPRYKGCGCVSCRKRFLGESK